MADINTGLAINDIQQGRLNSTTGPGSLDQKRHSIKPATFDGSTSWSDFRAHFEVCAELNCWSAREKGMYLAVSLRGIR